MSLCRMMDGLGVVLPGKSVAMRYTRNSTLCLRLLSATARFFFVGFRSPDLNIATNTCTLFLKKCHIRAPSYNPCSKKVAADRTFCTTTKTRSCHGHGEGRGKFGLGSSLYLFLFRANCQLKSGWITFLKPLLRIKAVPGPSTNVVSRHAIFQLRLVTSL
jgi:hypothetical protein